MAVCKSCRRPVVWAVTEARDGKPARPIPLDAEDMGGWNGLVKCDNGNVVPVGRQPARYGGGTELIVRVVAAGPDRYRAHWASCPTAKEHRQ